MAACEVRHALQWQAMDRNRLAIAAVGCMYFRPAPVLFAATCVDAIFVAPLIASMAAILAAYAAPRWSATLLHAAVAGLLVSLSLLLTFGTACLGVFFGLELLMSFRGGAWKRRLATLAMVLAIVTISSLMLYWKIGYDTIACLSGGATKRSCRGGMGYETLSWYLDLSIAHVLALPSEWGLPLRHC